MQDCGALQVLDSFFLLNRARTFSPSQESESDSEEPEHTEKDWTVVWETMEDAFPDISQGPKPKKSVARPPQVGDMICTPNNQSVPDDDQPFWVAQLVEVNRDELVVRWWGADEFLGTYVPLDMEVEQEQEDEQVSAGSDQVTYNSLLS